jgi:hypothetical protein
MHQRGPPPLPANLAKPPRSRLGCVVTAYALCNIALILFIDAVHVLTVAYDRFARYTGTGFRESHLDLPSVLLSFIALLGYVGVAVAGNFRRNAGAPRFLGVLAAFAFVISSRFLIDRVHIRLMDYPAWDSTTWLVSDLTVIALVVGGAVYANIARRRMQTVERKK